MRESSRPLVDLRQRLLDAYKTRLERVTTGDSRPGRQLWAYERAGRPRRPCGTPQGPHTRTVITYSESANHDSPHYSDQTLLFARGQMITERFTEAEINADPRLQTTTLYS